MQEGQFVVIKEDNIPLLQWCLDRVMEVKFGTERIFPITIVKAAKGATKKAIFRMCSVPLLTDSYIIQDREYIKFACW